MHSPVGHACTAQMSSPLRPSMWPWSHLFRRDRDLVRIHIVNGVSVWAGWIMDEFIWFSMDPGSIWIWIDMDWYGLIWIDIEIGSYEDILVIMGNGVVNSKCPNFAHDLSLPDGTALPVMRSDCTGTKIGLCFFWILAPLAAERTWSP